MSTENPRIIDQDGLFGLDEYPFRLQRNGPERVLEAFVKLFMWPVMITGLLWGPALFLLLINLNVRLLPQSLAGGIFLVGGLAVFLAAEAFLWRWQERHHYDAAAERFCLDRRLLKRWKTQCWNADSFSGISVGHRLSRGYGGSPVVRLHAKVEGFLLDAFLNATSLEQARELAARLAELSGLPLLEERNTGPQDDLNDLRKNPWLLQRLTRRGVWTTSQD